MVTWLVNAELAKFELKKQQKIKTTNRSVKEINGGEKKKLHGEERE